MSEFLKDRPVTEEMLSIAREIITSQQTIAMNRGRRDEASPSPRSAAVDTSETGPDHDAGTRTPTEAQGRATG